MTLHYCKKDYVTTNRNHKQLVFANRLQCQFSVLQPDQAYASDLTNVWTQEGLVALTVFIDLCSRKVLGLSMSMRMKARLPQECTSSPAKIGVWNIQRLQPFSKSRVQEPVGAQRFLDAQVTAPPPGHEGA